MHRTKQMNHNDHLDIRSGQHTTNYILSLNQTKKKTQKEWNDLDPAIQDRGGETQKNGMNVLCSKIICAIVAAVSNVKPEKGYELFLERVSASERNAVEAAGTVMGAEVITKISLLKMDKVGNYSNDAD